MLGTRQRDQKGNDGMTKLKEAWDSEKKKVEKMGDNFLR